MKTIRGNTNGTDYIITSENGKLLILWDSTAPDGSYLKKCKSVKVHTAAGYSWKLNKKSVSCASGYVGDILDVLTRYDAYANVTAAHFID